VAVDNDRPVVECLRPIHARAAAEMTRRGAVVRRRHRTSVVVGRYVHHVAFGLDRLRTHCAVSHVNVHYTTEHIGSGIEEGEEDFRIDRLRGPFAWELIPFEALLAGED